MFGLILALLALEIEICSTGTYVDLSDRELTSLPANIPNDVEYLNISYNSFNELDTFPALPFLEKLFLDNNSL